MLSNGSRLILHGLMAPLENPLQTLKRVKLGEIATIRCVESSNCALRNRLLSLGLVEGRRIRVTRKAPLGGAIGIQILGFSLALRLTEAEAVSIFV